MGKLVTFDKRRRLARPKGESVVAEGKIVIFPGVRYERNDPSLPTNGSTPARPKRKRG